MLKQNTPTDKFIKALEERAKELNCLYKIEELFNTPNVTLEKIIWGIIESIPPGWQYSDYCHARIVLEGKVFEPEGFFDTPWVLATHIRVQEEPVGTIFVYYTEEMPAADEGPFLREERKLLNSIADRIGARILHMRLKRVFEKWQSQKTDLLVEPKPEWSIILDMLRRTDQHLFSIISRKMINYLFCKGVKESKELFKKLGTNIDDQSLMGEINRPSRKHVLESSFNLGVEIFHIASAYFSNEELLNLIQKWIHEEKSHFLIKALANRNTPLSEIADALRRYYHINPDHEELASPIAKGIRVSLVRRLMTDQLQFINIAKSYCSVGDFYELLQNMIFPAESHGKLGGKSSGLFLAKKIIEKASDKYDVLRSVKTPKTWYIASDGLTGFVYYNNLEEVIDSKYKEIEEIRQEYPHIVQAFKNSNYPAEIINGLSRALDDFGDNPIIVRSSSLLEDRMGSAFAGKYKSLFLANQGTKKEKIDALMDAISEVYASTFGPDPIGYRTERGLLDFNEEMGIMIQEVVGTRIGNYFLPAFAGVAFSKNEFRWSPRISRDDGLIRMVIGLGTRAVDRLSDDYPTLIAPGKPELRVNLTYDEIVGYAQKKIDVINLETNTFETIPIKEFISQVQNNIPLINEMFSIDEGSNLRKPVGLGIDTKKHEITATFENLISTTNYISQILTILKVLAEKLETPVDIEFACDGNNLYLLQCRPQSSSVESSSAMIPRDIDHSKILFNARQFISNGPVSDINYTVYIDPESYARRDNLQDLKDIGIAVGRLNKLLPKKTFILMGPGRWGSRDDIKLGVRVSYSDICNTAVLIEIARKKGNYVPDLSFGTHFFQDLVEASIRYLPLYPDDPGIIFNDSFFKENENILTRFLPEYEYLSDTLKVINVRESTGGQILRILINADEAEAVGFFTDPGTKVVFSSSNKILSESANNEPLQWRLRMAESLALQLDPARFGVEGIYLFGTVFNETAGPNSDIDFIICFRGTEQQKNELMLWLEGWNLALSQINYNKSGYRLDKFVDAIILTDEEIAKQQYYGEILDSKKNKSKQLKLKDNSGR